MGIKKMSKFCCKKLSLPYLELLKCFKLHPLLSLDGDRQVTPFERCDYTGIQIISQCKAKCVGTK